MKKKAKVKEQTQRVTQFLYNYSTKERLSWRLIIPPFTRNDNKVKLWTWQGMRGTENWYAQYCTFEQEAQWSYNNMYLQNIFSHRPNIFILP